MIEIKKITGVCIIILILFSIAIPFFSFAEKGKSRGGPYYIYGYVYKTDGVTPLANNPVTITNVTGGQYVVVNTDWDGYYQYDVGSIWNSATDDPIKVNATDGTYDGENTTTVNTAYLGSWCNVTLGTNSPMVISTTPKQDDVACLGTSIVVTFSKAMNTATVGADAGSLVNCDCSPDPGGWTAVWSDGDTKLTLSHSTDFASGSVTFNITGGKDTIGLFLVWNTVTHPFTFTVKASFGDFTTMDVEYPNPALTGSKYSYTITVTVINDGADAFGTSQVTVSFYWTNNPGQPLTSWNSAGTGMPAVNATGSQFIPAAKETSTLQATATVTSASFSFPSDGKYYIAVNISSSGNVIKGSADYYLIGAGGDKVSTSVTAPSLHVKSFALTLTDIGIAVLVVALLGTAVWRKKEKKG